MPARLPGVRPLALDPVPDLVGRAQPLAEQVRAHARLRWLVVAAIPAAAVLGREVLGFRDLPLAGLLALAGAIAAYNVVLLALLRGAPGPRRPVGLRHASVALDFVALTVGLWLAGGAGSPLVGLYLVHVVLSSMLLGRGEALAHTALGFLLYAGLAFGQWGGAIPAIGPRALALGVAGARLAVPVALVAGAGLLMFATTMVARPVVDRLRENERRLAAVNAELRELARLRRDFLHITIHDIKAPIAAVRSILTAIRAGHAGEVTPELEAWVDRCLERLAGLSGFLRDLALLADLDDRALRERAEPVDLGELVRSVVEENRDLARPRGLEVVVRADRDLPRVEGQPRLLREAVYNYLSNAIRHSPEGGTITIRVGRHDGGIRVEVADDGPGIPESEQGKLFQEFARIRVPGRPAGRPAGSGLGLSIVRRIVALHGGRVGVVSRPGEGSTFWFELPAAGIPTPVTPPDA